MDKIFDRLIQAGLKLNPNKCVFCLPGVIYLGIRVNKDGQFPEASKLKSIANFPIPKNITGVRSFIGLCSYYRKFIKDFAVLAKPLTTLTKNDVGFRWGPKEQQAFETLKYKMITPPILAHFEDNLSTEVRTDVSFDGIGAVILQEHPEGMKPVAYASRQLLPRERNYTISEQECLAIVFALEQFRPYLESRRFRVVTDHCSLCFLNSKRKLPSRLMRWALLLQEFDMEIVYKSGKHHRDVDSLSR